MCLGLKVTDLLRFEKSRFDEAYGYFEKSMKLEQNNSSEQAVIILYALSCNNGKKWKTKKMLFRIICRTF